MCCRMITYTIYVVHLTEGLATLARIGDFWTNLENSYYWCDRSFSTRFFAQRKSRMFKLYVDTSYAPVPSVFAEF